MADVQPSIQIDSDWKKQAQEEKKRLAEQQRAVPSSPAAAPADKAAESGAARAGTTAARTGAAREMPDASFATLVQSIMTQALYHLGDLTPRGGEPAVNLDLAKHHVDTLSLLEEKTKNNLSDSEKRTLDAALYEVRMRYVNVASQYIT